MKSKNKQLPSSYSQVDVPSQYNSCKQIIKKPSIKQHSHMPISNSNYTISIKKQHKDNYKYESCTKPSGPKVVKSSPYVHLPSIPIEENNQNMNFSNMSDRYYEKEEKRLKNYQKSEAGSIYEQFRLDQKEKISFQTEESQASNQFYGQQQNFYDKKYWNSEQIQTKRKNSGQFNSISMRDEPQTQHTTSQSRSQSRCIHKSPNFTKNKKTNIDNSNYKQHQQYYSVNYNSSNRSQLQTLNISQQMVKKQIDQKLDRVCQKIENLSKEKERKDYNTNPFNKGNHRNKSEGASAKWLLNGTNQNSNFRDQKDNRQNHTPKSTKAPQHHAQASQYQYRQNTCQYRQQENKIQQRIIPPSGPTHQQFLQSHIIELDKKIIFANSKILRLEEQLLQERQKLIKKQKQWLLRENQLLNWIQANQIEGQFIQINNKNSSQTKDQGINSSLTKSHARKASNIIVDDNSSSLNTIRKNNEEIQILKCKLQQSQNVCEGLSQLVSQMIKVFKVNQNWLALMNRTLSHELPGTAFRVKEQMNLNHHSFLKLSKLCESKLTEVKNFLHQKEIITPKLSISSKDLSQTHSIQQSPFATNSSLSQSQVFLLESYFPPVSQQFEIQTTKRSNSKVKPSEGRRKSVSCLSESKSASSTNKKYSGVSTHKKSQKKQSKNLDPTKLNDRPIQNLYNSRKSEYYCDQVFYSRAKEINSIEIEQIKLSEQKNPKSQKNGNQLYYLLSIQALTIETLIPQNPSSSTTLDQDNEENLLSGINP